MLTRFRIGQISHSLLIANEAPPIFTACGVQITIKHIILDFRLYHNIRTSSNQPKSLAEILQNQPQRFHHSHQTSNQELKNIRIFMIM